MPSGYSETPLAKKLGFKDGMRVLVQAMPETVRAEIEGEAQPEFVEKAAIGLPAAHLFVTEAEVLRAKLDQLHKIIARDGMIWVSWPKRASGVETDISEDLIREIAVPMGLVDVKVCAIDEVWSGLKLVIRKALR